MEEFNLRGITRSGRCMCSSRSLFSFSLIHSSFVAQSLPPASSPSSIDLFFQNAAWEGLHLVPRCLVRSCLETPCRWLIASQRKGQVLKEMPWPDRDYNDRAYSMGPTKYSNSTGNLQPSNRSNLEQDVSSFFLFLVVFYLPPSPRLVPSSSKLLNAVKNRVDQSTFISLMAQSRYLIPEIGDLPLLVILEAG